MIFVKVLRLPDEAGGRFRWIRVSDRVYIRVHPQTASARVGNVMRRVKGYRCHKSDPTNKHYTWPNRRISSSRLGTCHLFVRHHQVAPICRLSDRILSMLSHLAQFASFLLNNGSRDNEGRNRYRWRLSKFSKWLR